MDPHAQVLLLPGWQNSGAAHWQSRWEARYGYQRVEQHDWMQPLRGDWICQLEEAVLASPAIAGNKLLIRGEKHLYAIEDLTRL